MAAAPAAASGTSADDAAYRSAVSALNQLQSNAANLEQALRERDARCCEKMPEMIRLAARLGISQEDYNSLRVVHITGTKGKGGTAAYVESILRCHGYRTGFYSSPHLVEVRERIRINGRPLSRAAFAEHFWRTHDCLWQKRGPDPMPAYFQFLTLMAVGVFLAERVDVAVMEVGIGGRYDSTNFVSAPWVCAVASLGLDHTALLGNSIGQIASQKAGILKPGCVGVTVEGQPAEGMAALTHEANLIGCPMLVAPPIGAYPDPPDWLIGCLSPSQLCNASLAVAVCRIWLRRRHGSSEEAGELWRDVAASFAAAQSPLSQQFLAGIRSAKWPGRNTVMSLAGTANCTLYIDGAHTVESVTQTASWFRQLTAQSSRPKALLFNRTGDRRASDLLRPLVDLNFRAALFCPNLLDAEPPLPHQSQQSPDLANVSVSSELATARVTENLLAFRELLLTRPQQSGSSCECLAFDSASKAVDWLIGCGRRVEGCDVLVTGSLHLVGCVFAKLAPHIATGEDA